MLKHRRLGNSDLHVSPVALGCWPLAGITSGAMSDAEAAKVIEAALDVGINHLDTAYAYGRDGESQRRVGDAIRDRRDSVVLADKVGIYWDEQGNVACTGRPDLLRRHLDEGLERLGLDHVDLLYFHAPADDAPIAESASVFAEAIAAGKARAIGVSNLSVDQIEAFTAECPAVACQIRYNMLQREAEADVIPWCRQHDMAVVAYEPLAMGLLTGKFARDHVFAEDDWRRRSPLFTDKAWEENLDTVDRLRPPAESAGCSLAQLSVSWAISQPGITVALCGAKRASQIRDTAGLDESTLEVAGEIRLG